MYSLYKLLTIPMIIVLCLAAFLYNHEGNEAIIEETLIRVMNFTVITLLPYSCFYINILIIVSLHCIGTCTCRQYSDLVFSPMCIRQTCGSGKLSWLHFMAYEIIKNFATFITDGHTLLHVHVRVCILYFHYTGTQNTTCRWVSWDKEIGFLTSCCQFNSQC